METKTVKVAAVHENQRNYSGAHGQIFIHGIKFEGSDQEWQYHSKSQNCEKFKVGETKRVDMEVVQRGQYTDYKVKPAKDEPGGTAALGASHGGKDSGIITYLSVFSSACNYYAQRTCTTEDVFSMAEKAFNTAMTKSTNK